MFFTLADDFAVNFFSFADSRVLSRLKFMSEFKQTLMSQSHFQSYDDEFNEKK